MKDYHGNRTPYLYALYHESDRTKVLSVLEAMDGRGFAFCCAEKQNISHVKKALAILAFLSADFYADEAKQNEFFAAKDSGVPLIPILLDDSPMPEIMQQAMYAKNSLIASRYPTDKALAERILTAEAFRNPTVTPAQKKASRTGLIGFCAAAAIVLAAGVWMVTMRTPKISEVIMEQIVSFGLTQHDLKKIQSVRIAGEGYEFGETGETATLDGYSRILSQNGSDMDLDFPSDSSDGKSFQESIAHTEYDERRWEYDGETLTIKEYDLDFLSVLPNVKVLNLVMVKADALPDLSGLKSLERLNMYDCDIPDITGLAGSSITWATLHGNTIQDYSPLSQCRNLTTLNLELGEQPCDLSTVAPPQLNSLILYDPFGSAGNPDFSGMRDGSKLEHLSICGKGLTDMTHISELSDLKSLFLTDVPNLQSFKGLSKLPNLQSLIQTTGISFSDSYISTVKDAEAELGKCTNLTELMIAGDLDSTDFLNNLTKLSSLVIHNVNRADLAFLNRIDGSQEVSIQSSNLTCSEPIQQKHINYLFLNFFNGSYEENIGDALKNTDIRALSLMNAKDLDKPFFPDSLEELVLYGSTSTLTDLKNLPKSLKKLNLYATEVQDWTGLEELTLEELRLTPSFTMPDFSTVHVSSSLTLENFPRLTNLDCLKGLLDRQSGLNLSFPGCHNLKDISILEGYQGGTLGVPPHLNREARLLVESGYFRSFEVVYSSPFEKKEAMEFTLESLDDLKLMTEDELAGIEVLAIAGDRIFDPSSSYAAISFSTNEWVIHNQKTNSRIYPGAGVISDFALLEKLPNLRSLTLMNQPLTSLDGIQKLDKLEELNVSNCPNLTDISAAFTLPKLTVINACASPVASIKGIQNLSRLDELNISHTNISDLSALEHCRFGDSVMLDVSDTRVKDLMPLRNIRNYSRLGLIGTSVTSDDLAALFAEVDSVNVATLELNGLNLSQKAFDLIISKLHGVYSIQLANNPNITDLSALLNLEGLQQVFLGSNTPAAAKLLEMNPSFEVCVWYSVEVTS